MKAIIAGPATLALCYRAYSHKSLTTAGIIAAGLTAIAHAVHPWNLPFVLLCVFYLAGTRVTKIKKDIKATLTEQSNGGSGGEGPRTHVQVLANSFVSTVFTLLHAYQLRTREVALSKSCYGWTGDLLVIGVIANYAAVCADTFSSELGILSTHSPRLITSLNLRKVPRGTNGGVTLWGLVAGVLGSMVITTTSMLFLPLCPVSPEASPLLAPGLQGGKGWGPKERQYFGLAMVTWGALGSVVDSFLGGWLQQSVVDKRTGKVVEGEGGKTVLVSTTGGVNSMHFKKRAEVKAVLEDGEGKSVVEKTPGTLTSSEVEEKVDSKMGGRRKSSSSSGDTEPSRAVESGLGLLDNNEVNFFMALTMSLGAMGMAAWAWEVPLRSAIPF